MLTAEIQAKLTEYFARLTTQVQLKCWTSAAGQQGELEALLSATAACHENVTFERLASTSLQPYFEIHRNHQPTGIACTGVPTGHEFSSLVLAIMNCDGQGQLPDETIRRRIQSLRGEAHLRTFISLSCTNCPIIVQALNLIAALHPEISHEMVDGAVATQERDELEVSSVPSVYHEGKLIHAGRATMNELIELLTKHLGTTDAAVVAPAVTPQQFDLVVVGGGPSGISAAIYGARKGLSTAIITETLGGQLNETVGIENFISIIYTEGSQLAAQLVEHVREYPVTILEHRRVKMMKSLEGARGQELRLSTGEVIHAGASIIATGARWRELGVKGEKAYLGKGVAYCPHCDGPYFKGKDVIVVGGGNSGVEAALDLAGIVRSVTLFEYQPELKADKVLVDVLKSRENTSIVTSAAVEEIMGDGSQVTSVRYRNPHEPEATAKEQASAAVFVQIGLVPNSNFLAGFVDLSPYGEVIIDEKNRASVPGVYAAGDVSTIPYKQIIISMGEGAAAALAAYEDSLVPA